MRAYDAENALHCHRPSESNPTVTLDEARTLAGHLFNVFDVPHVEVRRGRSQTGRSVYWHPHRGRDAWISLHPTYATRWTVCHEVAHHVARVSGADRGHGPQWAAIYVRAVREGIGLPEARLLANALRYEGLRVPVPT